MDKIIKKFVQIFDGYELAYGQHNNFVEDSYGKMNGRAETIPAKLNPEIIEKHLNGIGASLGIIPLKKNNKCKFGAIDIDIKHPTNPLTHTIYEIENKINSLALPLVICQSKSKGIHLYCFTQTEIPASILINKLKEWASLIGYGTAEVFPKQTYRVNKNDIGNWINLPYYNYKNTIRFAINKKKILTLEQFFEFVEVVRISERELKDFKIDNLDETYKDAPPCLQILINTGIEEGSRNNGLYNFAVYFKNKYPDNWQDKVFELNGKILKPVLNMKEVETIIKTVNRKEYFYKCKEYPICQFCNKVECYNRKYGVGKRISLNMELDNLTKYVSGDSVYWYAEWQGYRIQLTTDDLLNQKLLQKNMLNQTNKIFSPIKQEKWLEKIEHLLTNCVVIVDPEDASKKGQFKELLDSFLTQSSYGLEKLDLLKGNPYFDKNKNVIYFKSCNLFTYLKNKKFYYSEHEVWHWIKALGAESVQMRIGNKKVRAWSIEAPEFYDSKSNVDKLI